MIKQPISQNITFETFKIFQDSFDRNFQILLEMNKNILTKVDYLNERIDNYGLTNENRFSIIENRIIKCETLSKNYNRPCYHKIFEVILFIFPFLKFLKRRQ